MNWVFLSSILFGLVHPGSKIILDTGMQLIDFCILYIGIRFIIQIPFFINSYNENNKVVKNYPWLLLILFGCVGASLQVSEFFGLTEGLSVATVTFLVYSHPIWSLILSYFINKESIGFNEILRVIIGIMGIYIISSQAIGGDIKFELKIVAPIFAGFLIALWSSLSNKLRKKGLSSLDVSFFYDLFALLAIITFAGFSSTTLYTHFESIGHWMQIPQNLIFILIYSVFIGLLPNFLFYFGSEKISNLNASLILLIEPVVASTIAFFFMKETVSPIFFLGALFILTSGLNFIKFKNIIKIIFLKNIEFRYYHFICILTFFIPIEVFCKKLYLIELSPQNQTDYTISQELKLIEKSADLSFLKAQKLFPQCKVDLIKHLTLGNEEDLFKFLQSIETKDKDISIVGLSRSIFARIGAKALKDKPISGYSIGASTAKLSEINKNFFSVASPLVNQVEAILAESKRLSCKKVTGLFDSKDPLSSEYKDNFKKLYESAPVVELGLDSSKVVQHLNTDCIFIGMNYSKSAPVLQQISSEKIKHIFGTGDWSIHSAEIMKTIKNGILTKSKKHVIYSPTGWVETINNNSTEYAKSIREDFSLAVNPIGAYTYDALLIAYETLCRSNNIKDIIKNGVSRTHLLRDYTHISSTNNLVSKMNIIKMDSKNEQ